MKYIIVGLGNFGSSLGIALTRQGHEVIAIDSSMQKVEAYKEVISHTICMDATDEYTVKGLPISDTDIVIVAIGEDQGENVMVTALFKTLKAKRLISRSINPLHEKVLQAIGVDDLIHPEKEAAKRWAKRLSLRYFVDSFELSDHFSLVEISIPRTLIGQSVGKLEFEQKFNIRLLSTLRYEYYEDSFGRTQSKPSIRGLAMPEQILQDKDVLVIYGANDDINQFLRSVGVKIK
ncbi:MULTISPECIES: potassium channel family protein [Psychrobacter]|uniref:Trk system potassium uptake protein TrkA n=1 Tax=Psychrobacter alimentarius TaxID=261164 RepID=A0ABM5ZZN7_9GAMM|nr:MULTISPECIES: TrkA family potassium uptake protein [Psychrobacter]AMT97625.1 Trk system potassium uptake protein TrkA [Psychrobacter alimentarius]QCB30081.1 TrkA family potassium uptake protein [Psychrobacter sp. PAMC27889]